MVNYFEVKTPWQYKPDPLCLQEDDYSRFIVVDEDGDLLTTGACHHSLSEKIGRNASARRVVRVYVSVFPCAEESVVSGRPTNPPKLKLRRLSFEAVKGTVSG